jgi:hypothetical protein
MSSNPPVKHHFIPEFLLKQWAVNEGKLWRFVQPIPGKIVPKHVAPAEIGYKKHLYSLPGLPASQAQKVETSFMSPLDSLAAEAHQLLLLDKAENMSIEHRSAWSRFIMSLWYRTPDGLHYLKKAMNLILRLPDDSMNKSYKCLRTRGSAESIEDIIAELEPEFPEKTAIYTLPELIDNPINGRRINNMNWFVVETIHGREFLISDALLLQSKTGIFSDDGYITIPIAPRKLFVAVSQVGKAKAMAALPRNEFIHRNNRAVVRRASVFVGSTDLSQQRFIKENFGLEQHYTVIRSLAERYRSEVENNTMEPVP